MKKALLLFAFAAICLAVALHFYHSDFSWDADASGQEDGPIADINQPVPHAVLSSLDNTWVDMASYKGKVVLISFWTTWCPGCVDEVPDLIQLQQKYAAKGFTVVAISVDDEGEESVQSFVQGERFRVGSAPTAINYPVLLGSDEIARRFGYEGGIPVSFWSTATKPK
jgi:thiol-disulfide isomerase/thioredoxin